MKVKEAVELLRGTPENELFGKLSRLFGEEGKTRVKNRSYGKKPTANTIRGVTDEMKQWVTQVAQALALPEDQLSLLLETDQGMLFVEFGVLDPKIADARRRVQTAMLHGQHPLEVLTREDVEAASSTALHRLFKVTERITRDGAT
jgi:hypothetical protein